jgi:alkaline phosphatase D
MRRILVFVLALFAPASCLAADLPRWLGSDPTTGASEAVIVGDWPLVHTSQVFGHRDGHIRGGVVAQATRSLERLADALESVRSGLGQVVKLNLYLTDEGHVPQVKRVLAEHFGAKGPAVSLVVTRLPYADALFALDAVATTGFQPGGQVAFTDPSPGALPPFPVVAVCPAGGRIYVAGQAERADSLAEATRLTLESLSRTLGAMGRGREDVVQLKAFLQPMADAATVEREVATFFQGAGPPEKTSPPLVLVEWQSSQRTPIEIELVAWGGSNTSNAAAPALVEYITPPDMPASPIFSRVARLHQTPSVYISGLYATHLADPSHSSAAAGEHEVIDIFASLSRILEASGSDLRHLVKATYYASTGAASRKLNELRPQYYDPARPPAASKAIVTAVGHPGLGLTVDMIAVPNERGSHWNLGDVRDALSPVLDSTVEVILENYRARRKYTSADFPKTADEFAEFRREIVQLLIDALDLGEWVVRGGSKKRSPVAHLFEDRLIGEKLDSEGGVVMEIHAVTFSETGLVVPMVLCLPPGSDLRPGVCAFSGHSGHGLQDLFLDTASYQHGIALQLARAGFASIAVEKIDSGLLSVDGQEGTDERAITSLLLGWGQVTRAQQLMACIAASEILALHPRVDESRIGATGVSLGGWLSVQTALLSDRIRAVADFGVKTLLIPEDTTPQTFQGIRDWCHILPGTLRIGDRNILSLAYCPRPMLAGHGRRDPGSSRDAPRHYEQLFREQYAALGVPESYEYHTHPGGDALPVDAVITYFKRQLMSVEVADSGRTIGHLQGEMAGELTSHSVLLQSRLTVARVDSRGDVPGVNGIARFAVARSPSFDAARHTQWLTAEARSDHVVKVKVDGLAPATRYYYRLEFGSDREHLRYGPVRTLRTHHTATDVARHRFVVVTGMNYHAFHYGYPDRPKYAASDRHLGYPALASIARLAPDFFVGTGDNVYYDAPRSTAAVDATSMRKKWHEQFVLPRYVGLFAKVPTYWEKDDHDYRYDDCDNETDKQPSVELGLKIFREQVPVTDPKDPTAVTYRTHRAGRLLQVWFPENRDYRSPNDAPNGSEKTIWGREQKEWLERTLLESDATFKIIVSPTPMIGPDDRRKRDNHCDVEGFIDEGDEFFAWAKKEGFLDKGLYFVCGDRHWQYHSIHPTGFEEFSCGALVDANSRLGMGPGDPKSSDATGKVRQPYTSREPSGGFLDVEVDFDVVASDAFLHFRFRDEHGALLHAETKVRELPR